MTRRITVPGRTLFEVLFTNGTRSKVWARDETRAREWAAARWPSRTVERVEVKS